MYSLWCIECKHFSRHTLKKVFKTDSVTFLTSKGYYIFYLLLMLTIILFFLNLNIVVQNRAQIIVIYLRLEFLIYIRNACENYWGKELKDQIVQRGSNGK